MRLKVVVHAIAALDILERGSGQNADSGEIDQAFWLRLIGALVWVKPEARSRPEADVRKTPSWQSRTGAFQAAAERR
jgi:hypothetical protein